MATTKLLLNYCHTLSVPCEILSAGRILLFYTPRKLLSNYKKSKNSLDFIEKIVVPSDQQQRKFRTSNYVVKVRQNFDAPLQTP